MKASKIKSRVQHNPPSSIPQVLKTIPEELKGSDKCKLYILLRPTPNNTKTLEVHHGVKLKNVNRVLSKRTAHNQLSAFVTVRDKSNPQSHRNRTFKIFTS